MAEVFEVMGGRLYQWDIGRKIRVNCYDGRIDEVHFAGDDETGALVVKVIESADGLCAEVPNVLLTESGYLNIWAVICNADGKYTKYASKERIIKRAKPDDYVYTETEVKRYEDLDKRITELEKSGGGGSGGGITTETDPTVPAWAKQPNKPTYTAEEVGAATKAEVDRLTEEIGEKQPKGNYALKSEIPVIPAPYTLPTASADVKGGVKVGEGLRMDGDTMRVKLDDKTISGSVDNDVILIWEKKSIQSSTGVTTATTTRCLSQRIALKMGDAIRVKSDSLKVFIHAFDDGGNYIGKITEDWQEGEVQYTAQSNVCIRIVAAFTNDAAIEPDDVDVSATKTYIYARSMIDRLTGQALELINEVIVDAEVSAVAVSEDKGNNASSGMKLKKLLLEVYTEPTTESATTTFVVTVNDNVHVLYVPKMTSPTGRKKTYVECEIANGRLRIGGYGCAGISATGQESSDCKMYYPAMYGEELHCIYKVRIFGVSTTSKISAGTRIRVQGVRVDA